MKLPPFLLSLVLALTACSTVRTETMPHADLRKIRHFFVEHRLSDNHHVDDLIVADLQSRGFIASDGPLTMMPDDAEAVISYADDWEWDFKSYLIELRIEIRRARLDQVLAAGSYRQPSPITKSPAGVVHVILGRILDKS